MSTTVVTVVRSLTALRERMRIRRVPQRSTWKATLADVRRAESHRLPLL